MSVFFNYDFVHSNVARHPRLAERVQLMEVCVCDIGAFPNWKLYKSFGDSVTNMRDSFLWGIVEAIISLIKMH